ncbi:MAG: mitofilin family membrane protein, partial [Pseudomonadota bacterium]|nr:mitofilin family membrane protein [Pseudomonadota bacterium]
GAPAAATRDALNQLRAADAAAARARAELTARNKQVAETATKSSTLTRDLAAQVTARLDALEDRLATLERAAPASVTAAPAPPPANLAPLRAADAALAEELAALRAESAERAQTLAAIEAAVAAATTHAADDAGALLAANLLARAVTAGVPFDAELASIAARDLPASDRQSLAAVAANGVVSGSALARRFEKLAPALVAAAPAPQGDGWWDTARARLTGLVAIRRVDGAGDDVAGRVARAEQALAANDFAAAITEIGALEGAAATRASDWLADARRRQAALDAVRALQARMVARLTRER